MELSGVQWLLGEELKPWAARTTRSPPVTAGLLQTLKGKFLGRLGKGQTGKSAVSPLRLHGEARQ